MEVWLGNSESIGCNSEKPMDVSVFNVCQRPVPQTRCLALAYNVWLAATPETRNPKPEPPKPTCLFSALLSSTTTQSASSVRRFRVSMELYGCTTTSLLLSPSLGNTEYVCGVEARQGAHGPLAQQCAGMGKLQPARVSSSSGHSTLPTCMIPCLPNRSIRQRRRQDVDPRALPQT